MPTEWITGHRLCEAAAFSMGIFYGYYRFLFIMILAAGQMVYIITQ